MLISRLLWSLLTYTSLISKPLSLLALLTSSTMLSQAVPEYSSLPPALSLLSYNGKVFLFGFNSNVIVMFMSLKLGIRESLMHHLTERLKRLSIICILNTEKIFPKKKKNDYFGCGWYKSNINSSLCSCLVFKFFFSVQMVFFTTKKVFNVFNESSFFSFFF